ncbi:MAG: MerR family DNA-binding protein [Hyphomicrobiales bacterium]
MENLTIAKAARVAGVGVETIRFYERKGLIEQPLKPQSGGFRTYPSATIHRITFIQQAQDLGFSLREIEELLALKADPGTDCSDVRKRASVKLQEVQNKVARLEMMGTALKSVIAACPSSGSLEGCSILGAMESASARFDR